MCFYWGLKMKSFLKKCCTSAAKQFNRENFRRLLQYVILAFLITLVQEMLSRRSVVSGISFLWQRPLAFAYDALIILSTLMLAMICRKRNFALLLISSVWVGLSIVNFVLLGYRSTPLTGPDIAVLAETRDIIRIYMGNLEIIAIMVIVAVVAGLLIFLWFRFKAYHIPFAFGLTAVVLSFLMLFGVSTILKQNKVIDSAFPNLIEAYDNNGFAYCFSSSVVYQGVDEPEDYSEERILSIKSQLDQLKTKRSAKLPNIVFVQLESFFDVSHLEGVTCSENPIPNFTRLMEEYSSGLFSVPAIGAGTVNTEFEVLTGMNLKHFGVGEYPYKTVVRNSVCPSAPYVLEALGYRAHAMHNNNATFYSRNKVYSNLGFENFTSVEYMSDVKRNPLNWAEDSVLTDEILKQLDATEERDFIFAVSVQAHGKYPTEVIDETQTITVEGIDESRKVGFEYYVNQLKETDAFVGALTEKLSDYPEDVVVVFYGDHLPSFDIQNEELNYGDVQTTEYVIWSNFEMKKIDRDVYAYQIMAELFDRLGIHEGEVFKYHQLNETQDEETYQSGLQNLEYDILYGEGYCYGGEMPYEATELVLGTREIAISNVRYFSGRESITIRGDGFTEYSMVAINDTLYETQFIDENILKVDDVNIASGDAVCIVQFSATDSSKELSRTEVYWYMP